jgi:hypothetical protein
MNMKRGWKILMWASLFIATVLLTVLAVQVLWNWLVPTLFSGPIISYYQAAGLLILCRILFKGFFGNYGGFGRGRWGYGPSWKDKWATMSVEDRERFKSKMREKCGWGRNVESDKA